MGTNYLDLQTERSEKWNFIPLELEKSHNGRI